MMIFLMMFPLATAMTLMNPTTVPLSKIHTGQISVGHYYAFYKAQAQAHLNPEQDWQTFSKKEYKILLEDVTQEVHEGVPVFIAPNGRMHAIDQHHDMYVLYTLAPDMHPSVPVVVQRDFTKEHLSELEFKKIVLNKGWIYHKHIDDVLDNPIGIKDLVDSPERSVVGMAFLRFEQSGIPLKGKHFVPFIQFLLIDFLKDQKYMSFENSFANQDVEKLVDLLENSREIKEFLKDRLHGTTPKELKNFLTGHS